MIRVAWRAAYSARCSSLPSCGFPDLVTIFNCMFIGRWSSFGNESLRLKEELNETMERLSKLKADMKPGSSTANTLVPTLDVGRVQQRNASSAAGPLSPSRHGTADLVDTGELRLSQMSSIEQRLMGIDYSRDGSTIIMPGAQRASQRSSAPNASNELSATMGNYGTDCTVREAVVREQQKQKPSMMQAEKLDTETMQKWHDIFRDRTRPQHPGAVLLQHFTCCYCTSP